MSPGLRKGFIMKRNIGEMVRQRYAKRYIVNNMETNIEGSR